MDTNTKITDMTLGELIEVITQVIRQEQKDEARKGAVVRGIDGLAELFGVSESTAKRIKASGVIDKAVSQSGRVIVTDAALALELFSKATHGRRNK